MLRLAASGISARFADTFAAWTVANYLDDTTIGNGLYGYNTLNLVDAGADSINSFLRPRLTASFGSYAASGSGSVRSWAAQYDKFTGGSGGLNVTFSGADNASFTVTLVKSTSAQLRQRNQLGGDTLSYGRPGWLGDGTRLRQHLPGGADRCRQPLDHRQSGRLHCQRNTQRGGDSHAGATSPTPSPTPSPRQCPPSSRRPCRAGPVTITLQAGWNLISLPVEPAAPLTAEGLLRLINLQGGQATDVNRWQAGAWNTHVAGLPFNDFPLESGRGYFVKATRASTAIIQGRALTAATPSRWRQAGIWWPSRPCPLAPRPRALLQSMASGGVKVVEIDRWNAGSWSAHLIGLPFNNFAIEPGAAYFVRASQAGTWTN